jgi:hypothetical protein
VKHLLTIIIYLSCIQISLAQPPLKGKFLSEYDLFLPEGKDSMYLVDRFKHGLGIVFDKAEITLERLKDGKYDTKELGKSGLIDAKGNWVLPMEADAIVIYNSRFARIKLGKKYRLFDLMKKKYVSSEYDLISELPNENFEVELGEFHGIINSKGEEFVPVIYTSSLSYVGQEFIAARKNGKFGVLDLNGGEIFPHQYEYVSGIGDRILLKEKEGYSLYNTNGEKLINQKFERVQSFLNSNLIPIKEGNQFRIFNIEKQAFVSEAFDEIFSLSTDPKGFYRTFEKGLFGVLDANFHPKLSTEFTSIASFKDGFATIEKNGKLGYINSNFEIIIPLEFDKVTNFFEGLALVEKGGKRGFINEKRVFVFEIGNQNIGFFHNGMARIMNGKKFGFIDKTGKEVISVVLDWADNFQKNSSLVYEKGEIYFVNSQGNKIKT